MSSPTKRPKHLQVLTKFSNRSFSSIASGSDSGTFHSAHAHPAPMEMAPISQKPIPNTNPPPTSATKSAPSPILYSMKMDRQDSGFSDGLPRSNRSSISSARRSSTSKQPSKRRTPNTSVTSSTRPFTKRASRSTPNAVPVSRSSTSSNQRPCIPYRHTTTYPPPPAQFFHFPTFNGPQNPPELEEEDLSTIPTPPPPTVQYWTSDSTRRLEYAAIDAASRGVKGFLIKMIPDCILPPASRHTRFCRGDEADDDLGSVRRYRLQLPEERCPNTAAGKEKGFWKGFGWGRARRGSC
jgi:hypothetical protein